MLLWQQLTRCHFVCDVHFFGAKFEEHCSNIYGDIDSVFYCLSRTINDKKESHSSLHKKSLQISSNLFVTF